MKITFVGLGLIGGSMAKALRLSGNHEIIAMDRDEKVLLDAISAGVISRKAGAADLADSDVVYLCLYPEAVLKFAEEHRKDFGKNTIVTDVCGIKSAVNPVLTKIAEEEGFTFIGAHPMAGKESNSFSSSDAALFLGASYILMGEKADAPRAYDILETLAKEMGFGRFVYTDPEEHDRMIAFTSQLPHVLACAYVMSPQCENHQGFSAGSYRDVSRVAKINAELWTDLFLSNQDALVAELDILSRNIDKLKEAVRKGDEKTLCGLLAEASEIKRKFG